MGYALKIVALTMGEIVHWVSIPLIAGTDMGDVEYAVDEWIAEQHVRVSHVDLGTQYKCSWFALSAVHELEEFEILLNRTIAEWAIGTRACGCTLLLCNDLCALLVNIGTSLLYEPYGKVPKLLEIVAGVVNVCPLEAKPLDIVLDTLDIFGILLYWVCVVETQVALTAIFLGKSEVDSNSLGMTDVQIAVWLWWETGLHSASVLTFCQIIDHFLLNEASRSLFFCFVLNNLFHILFYFFTLLPFYLYLIPLSFNAFEYFAAFFRCS